MRHLVASITIAASALLAVGGTALATDAHKGVPQAGIAPFKGQPGSNGGVSCQTLQAGFGTAASPPGQVGATNNSPYIDTTKAYAGTAPNPSTNNGNPTAVAEYDVACLQNVLH
jgi:hypothetical protein